MQYFWLKNFEAQPNFSHLFLPCNLTTLKSPSKNQCHKIHWFLCRFSVSWISNFSLSSRSTMVSIHLIFEIFHILHRFVLPQVAMLREGKTIRILNIFSTFEVVQFFQLFPSLTTSYRINVRCSYLRMPSSFVERKNKMLSREGRWRWYGKTL